MKIHVLSILILTILSSCFQNKNQKNETNSEIISELKINNDTLIMFEGIWVRHDKSSFTILDLRNFRNIQYYVYLNREIEINEKDPKFKHGFYTSKGSIKYCGPNSFFNCIQLSVQTNRYRFDYILKNDSLYLWTESGLMEPLIRFESSDK